MVQSDNATESWPHPRGSHDGRSFSPRAQQSRGTVATAARTGVMYRFRSVMPNARRAPDVTGCESASRIPRHCPGQKPPFCAVKRPVHLYKNAIERKVTAKNAKAAYTPRAGPDSQREAECVVDDDVVEDQAEAGAPSGRSGGSACAGGGEACKRRRAQGCTARPTGTSPAQRGGAYQTGNPRRGQGGHSATQRPLQVLRRQPLARVQDL